MNSLVTKLSIGVIVTLLILFPVWPNSSFAQGQIEEKFKGSFGVRPGKVEVQLWPGEQKIVAFQILNQLGGAKSFQIETEDISGSSDPEKTVELLGDDTGPYSLKDYIQIGLKKVVLEENEVKSIPVMISIPSDAEPGGRYGAVLVSTVNDSSENSQSSALISRIGTLFFVKVLGAVSEAGTLKGFTLKNNLIQFQDEPINFRLLYENSGSVHLNPYGEIRIKNIIGQEVGYLWVEPWYALPDSLRLREVSWSLPFLFGRYTAIASINRGYGNIVDTAFVSFWILPWKALLVVFVLVTVVIAGLRYLIHKLRRSV